MTIVEIQKKIASILPNKPEPFKSFLKDSLLLQLQEINKKIAVFEGKYNKDFKMFQDYWNNLSDSKKFAYEVESDYLDWEALASYKQELMKIIYSL